MMAVQVFASCKGRTITTCSKSFNEFHGRGLWEHVVRLEDVYGNRGLVLWDLLLTDMLQSPICFLGCFGYDSTRIWLCSAFWIHCSAFYSIHFSISINEAHDLVWNEHCLNVCP